MPKSLKFHYVGRMPALNDYIKVNRGNKGKFFGNGMKKFLTNDIAERLLAKADVLPHFTRPVIVEFHWIEINKKRDPDNFVFAKKFVLDGLVKAGILDGDGWKHIAGFGKETWEARPDTEGGVIVTITEVE